MFNPTAGTQTVMWGVVPIYAGIQRYKKILVKNSNIRKFGDFQCNASLYAEIREFFLYFTLHPIPFKLPSLFYHCAVNVFFRTWTWTTIIYCSLYIYRKGYHWGMCYQLLKGIEIFFTKTCISPSCAGIFKQSMGARNRVGIGLSYWPARLHGLAELVPWNRFLCSLKV